MIQCEERLVQYVWHMTNHEIQIGDVTAMRLSPAPAEKNRKENEISLVFEYICVSLYMIFVSPVCAPSPPKTKIKQSGMFLLEYIGITFRA